MTLTQYSNDGKAANILERCGSLLKGGGGGKLGVFNTTIYGKTVRCSFRYFEQCMSIISKPQAYLQTMNVKHVKLQNNL